MQAHGLLQLVSGAAQLEVAWPLVGLRDGDLEAHSLP